jgi:Glycogen recognition site of AMP-activated protein kinase
MKHRLLRRACLLVLLASAGCAEATQGPDPAANVDAAQAGHSGEHAGAAGNPFQTGIVGGGSGSSGSLDAGGAAGSAVVAGGGMAGATAASGGSFAGGSPNVGGGGSPSIGGSGDPSSLAGSNSAAGSGSSESCAPRTFSYSDPSHVLASVGVSGSFNAWDKAGIPLTYDAASQTWQLAMMLAAGTYQYKFVVNGSDWKADPDNSNSVGDGFGGVNSVVVCQ